jgi:hypothetical protein
MPPNKGQPDGQGIWERLRELGIEFPEYFHDRISQTFESLYNPRSMGWRSLLERYAVGYVGFHVHLQNRASVRPDLLNAPYLCATFEWPRTIRLNKSERDFWREAQGFNASDTVEPDQERGEVEVAMLVDVPEFVKNRKRVPVRFLPTVERLQALELCTQSWSDTPEAIRWLPTPGDAPTGGVSLAGVEAVDRESDLSPPVVQVGPLAGNDGGRHVSIGESELPNEMIQRGAEVVNHVPDDGPPFLARRLDKGFTVDDYLASLRVVLGVNSVQIMLLDERLDALTEELQVYIRPLDLPLASIQRVAHG